MAQAVGFCAKTDEPVGQGHRINPARTRGAVEMGSNFLDGGTGNAEGHRFRTRGVVLECHGIGCVDGRIVEGWMLGPENIDDGLSAFRARCIRVEYTPSCAVSEVSDRKA